jgi:hypothetical protein
VTRLYSAHSPLFMDGVLRRWYYQLDPHGTRVGTSLSHYAGRQLVNENNNSKCRFCAECVLCLQIRFPRTQTVFIQCNHTTREEGCDRHEQVRAKDTNLWRKTQSDACVSSQRRSASARTAYRKNTTGLIRFVSFST